MKNFLLTAFVWFCYTGVSAQKAPKPEIIYMVVEEQAEFPGGSTAFTQYVEKNLHYPQIAREALLEGKCYLKFVVEKDGSIASVSIARGVPSCEICDKEAMRVLKNMPKWKPGKINGKAVRSYYDLPIAFILD